MGCTLEDSITRQKIMRNKNSQFPTEIGSSYSLIFLTAIDILGKKAMASLNIFLGIVDMLPYVCYNMGSKYIQRG